MKIDYINAFCHIFGFNLSILSWIQKTRNQTKQILSTYQNYIMFIPTFEQNKTTNSKKHISKNALLYITVDFVDIFQFLKYRLI